MMHRKSWIAVFVVMLAFGPGLTLYGVLLTRHTLAR